MLLVRDAAYSTFGLVDAVGISCVAQTCWATTESTGRRIRLNSSKQPHSPPWHSPLKILAQSVYFCWSVQFVTTCHIVLFKNCKSLYATWLRLSITKWPCRVRKGIPHPPHATAYAQGRFSASPDVRTAAYFCQSLLACEIEATVSMVIGCLPWLCFAHHKDAERTPQVLDGLRFSCSRRSRRGAAEVHAQGLREGDVGSVRQKENVFVKEGGNHHPWLLGVFSYTFWHGRQPRAAAEDVAAAQV